MLGLNEYLELKKPERYPHWRRLDNELKPAFEKKILKELNRDLFESFVKAGAQPVYKRKRLDGYHFWSYDREFLIRVNFGLYCSYFRVPVLKLVSSYIKINDFEKPCDVINSRYGSPRNLEMYFVMEEQREYVKLLLDCLYLRDDWENLESEVARKTGLTIYPEKPGVEDEPYRLPKGCFWSKSAKMLVNDYHELAQSWKKLSMNIIPFNHTSGTVVK